ncbi:hypothetical protein CXZ10_05800 [Pleomorphomonas diazotrophica]|uniref:Sialate O-acetylesterase domain-containing protein n=1 Tax=Pleomorphomonas diazotrophica TaxID=1166257 RepID=A0A1I4Q8M7_9HYPH|nr:sialate O-acetylesterase [Pleomorphomonas diazotrophica]PKR90862.1 hypothetical protein CXZ10_05800 [Pleomorphomonas diazotrophica]SFM36407.1 hypothetical protein SAMN05192571_101152 [Pleomorphomonas diazotrophica]
MADGGVQSSNLPLATTVDSILGNAGGTTSRQRVTDLAAQLVASDPMRLATMVGNLYDTEADLPATTAQVTPWVYADPDPDKIGIYKVSGGQWVWALPLPYSIIPASIGDGDTVNVRQLVTALPVVDGTAIIIPVVGTNTASPVVVHINGGVAITLKTNSGSDIDEGGLPGNGRLMAIREGAILRLNNDVVATAVLAATETARDLAKDFANAPEDQQVQPGLYSAKHWATKAAAADAGSGAAAARVASETAAAISIAAKSGSEAARDITQMVAANAQAVARTLPHWTDLLNLTSTVDGQGAEVIDADTGTHLQATSTGYDGASVPNAGKYSLNLTWGRWVWIGPTGLAGKADVRAPIQELRKLELFGSTALRAFTGSLSSIIPFIVDAVGKAIFYIDPATGEMKGRFDVEEEINRWLRANVGGVAEGLRQYSGAGPIYPLAADAVGRALIYFNSSTQKIHIPDLYGAGSSSSGASRVQTREALAAAQQLPTPSPSIWFGFLSYGQSLSIGAQGKPAISVTQPFSNLTFGAGPKTTLTGNGFGGQNQSAMDTSKPLVEDDLSPDALTTRGETVCSGTVNGAVELAVLENGINPSDLIFFASACGKGSESINSLVKTAAPDTAEVPTATANYYTNFIDHVTRAKAIATAAGKTYVVAAISWMQGESDSSSMTKTTYKALLDQLINDMQNDVVAITGQATKPHVIVYQQGAGITTGPTRGPVLAMWELSRERPDVWMGTPLYFLEPASDSAHLVNTSYHYVGRAEARVLKSIVVDKLKPRQVKVLGASLSGSVIRLRMDVPTPPHVIDETTLGAVLDRGFKVVSDAGTATIADISASGTDLLLTLSGTAPTTNIKLRYGLDYGPASHPSGKLFSNASGGNLRDSTPDVFTKGGVTRELPFFWPSFEISVFPVEA